MSYFCRKRRLHSACTVDWTS